MLVLAHIGHWYGELLYVAPVVLVVAWLGLGNLRERRRLRRDGALPAATPERPV